MYFQPSERVFFVIKGKNVRIINKNYYSPVILVLADNIYIDRLNGNNILLVANNIFIGSTRTSYSQELPISIESGLVCAKNILSIGKTWAIPPFHMSKKELLSKEFSIDRNYEKMSNLYISAETYLYGCEKEGIALDCALGMQCYEQIKQSIDKWLEINNPFMPTFWE